MRPLALFAIGLAAVIAACTEGPGRVPPPAVPDGNPRAGEELILEFGCGACHVIPGVRDADATVGPPLTDFGRRQYIAGALANNPENLVRWLVDPGSVEPGTAMPDVGLTEEQARDIAAYLFSLR